MAPRGTMTGMTTDADLRELTVGTGAGGEQLGTDMVLNIGPSTRRRTACCG